MNAIRAAIILGAIPVVVGLIYFGLQWAEEERLYVDPAGIILLIALGVSMGFGMLIVLHGARDL